MKDRSYKSSQYKHYSGSSISDDSDDDDTKVIQEVKTAVKHCHKRNHSSHERDYVKVRSKKHKHRSREYGSSEEEESYKDPDLKKRRRCKKHKHIIDKEKYLKEYYRKKSIAENKHGGEIDEEDSKDGAAEFIKEESLSENEMNGSSKRNKDCSTSSENRNRKKEKETLRNHRGDSEQPSSSGQSMNSRIKVKIESSDNSDSEDGRSSPDWKRKKSGVPERNDRVNNAKVKQEANEDEYSWGKRVPKTENKNDSQKKDKPNFEVSGKLAEDTNMYNGVVIKYSEPPEARKPKLKWRLYPFKGTEGLPTLFIHRQSAYLLGRDRKVADIPIDHPSCSKQHAALQYRLVPYQREDGTRGKRVRPYIVDLDSSNGTFVNNKKIDPRKYVELFERDVIKFGFSSREYVILHEQSKDDDQDDDDDGD